MDTSKAKNKYIPQDHHWAIFDKFNKQHMYILSLAYQIGWTKIYNNKTVVDLSSLGAWLRSPKSSVRKKLKFHSKEELQTTIYQLEQILKSEVS